MQDASAEDVAKLITPAADIQKPADTGPNLIGDIPKTIIPDNPALVPAEDLLDGASIINDDATPTSEASAAPDASAATNGAPVTDGKRGRGRPRGSRNKPSFADITAAEAIPTDYNQLADVTFDVSTGVLVMAFGEEWKPRNEDEKKAVCGPLAGYLKSKDVKDIPPGVLLAIVVTAYAAPRLRSPETSGKLKLGWQWFKVKIWPGFVGFFRRNKNKNLKLVPTNESKPVSGN